MKPSYCPCNFIVKLEYTTKMIITYDDAFNQEVLTTLGKAIERAEYNMKQYGFVAVDIIDAETGEIIASIDCQED